MNPNTEQTPNPWQKGTQEVEEVFARFSSIEKRRLALRDALLERPDDPSVQRTLSALTSREQVQAAALKGIFMSYARSDEIFALELSVRLCNDNFDIWLDMVDAGNEDWALEVQGALNTSGLMIAVLSPRALTDPVINAERERFSNMGKLILPVISRRCLVELPPMWLEPIDFSQGFKVGMHILRELLVPAATSA